MDLTNWIIILAVALLAVTFFCTRAPANWSLENRARRATGTRMIAQATISLWFAFLIVIHGMPVAGHRFVVHSSPASVLGCAAILVAFSFYWSIRGSRLLKSRRLFSAC
jgi:hypothetical protein